jgi:hypothetical protein
MRGCRRSAGGGGILMVMYVMFSACFEHNGPMIERSSDSFLLNKNMLCDTHCDTAKVLEYI